MPDISSIAAPLSIYTGHTRHTRYVPFEQSFAYRLFLLDIDIDRLEAAGALSQVFSVDAPNLFSFYRRDHGPRKDTPLRTWAEDMFQSANIDLEGGPIRLVTMPRHLFYKFAPISLWFGHGPDGDVRGIIYEVNNTFGDTHAYVATAGTGTSKHEADKRLYVSPFFDVTGRYRFTLKLRGDGLGLVIDNMVDGARTHMASLKAKRSEATTSTFLKAALAYPLSSHGITFAIHWEALKLWLKGAGYRSRPEPSAETSTHALPQSK